MELQTLAEISPVLQTTAVALLIFAVGAFFQKLNYRAKLAKLPALGGDVTREKRRQIYLAGAIKDYAEGYQKFRNRVYRMITGDGEDNVVIPPNLLPELRKLPDDVLSFPLAIEKTMEVKYTKLEADSKLIVHSVQQDLTPALTRLNETIAEEVDATVRQYLPPCEDWTEILVDKELVTIIAQISGRIFVGPELCKEPKYLDSGINYTLDVMKAVNAIKKMRPWLRPFLASSLQEVRQLRRREKEATEFLEPLVQERVEAQKKDPNWQPPDDMMQWMLNRSKGLSSVKYIAKMQLGLTFAAIHTTSMTATNILYTLAATPEYVEPLREEIRTVMADNGGLITSRALQQLLKLDSYMKEVIRCYPPGVTSFSRRVLKGITLSNGQYIPPGVVLEVPAREIYIDSKNYPDGETFDGFRAYKLRQTGSSIENARNQFVTSNETNLMFGYGRHACPGRFFAANEIKMILVTLLLEYDIKMPDGGTTRHPQLVMGRSSVPFPGKPLLFKRVV